MVGGLTKGFFGGSGERVYPGNVQGASRRRQGAMYPDAVRKK